MKQNDGVRWSRWNERLNDERVGGRSKLKEREDKVWSIGWNPCAVRARVCSSVERGAAMIYDSRSSKRDENDQTV